MSVIHAPNDKFFKSAMTNLQVAQEFFEQHLPQAIRARLDFNTLKLQPGSFINQELQHTASDILYKVNFFEGESSAYLYILAEHQSSVDNLMPLRLWQYIIAIWNEIIKENEGKKKKVKLPLVIPLVFYNGQKKYDGPLHIQELIQAPQDLIQEFLFKPFRLIDTHDISDEDFRNQHGQV